MIFIFDKRLSFGRFEVKAQMRSRKYAMCRFGGGWNWKLGVQIGSTTLIFDLLVMSIIIKVKK